MEQLIKAIKASKEVFFDVQLDNDYMWVKVDKKYLISKLEQWPARARDIVIVSQYGKSALYLAPKL